MQTSRAVKFFCLLVISYSLFPANSLGDRNPSGYGQDSYDNRGGKDAKRGWSSSEAKDDKNDIDKKDDKKEEEKNRSAEEQKPLKDAKQDEGIIKTLFENATYENFSNQHKDADDN